MSKPITITNPKVIEFFEKNEIYEPNLLFSVLIKQFIDNNSSQQQQNPPSIDKQILISKEELSMFIQLMTTIAIIMVKAAIITESN